MFAEGRLTSLRKRVYSEFSDAADYVWKSPRLLDHERQLERDKLDAYFPDAHESTEASALRDLRWVLEKDKIDNVFPYLIAVGNFVSLVSLFETYCLRLSAETHAIEGTPLPRRLPSGLTGLFELMSARGVNPAALSLHEQVLAAIEIRNCLMHASGLLNWSRGEQRLRAICAQGTHLAPEHRENWRTSEYLRELLIIAPTPLGDRVMINNYYAHLVSGYFRDYVCDLCDRFIAHFSAGR